MVFFHSTPISNLPSIRSNGLTVNNSGRTNQQSRGKIYLTDHIIYAIEIAQEMRRFYNKNIIVLKIKGIQQDKFQKDPEYSNGFYITENIPKEFIDVVGTLDDLENIEDEDELFGMNEKLNEAELRKLVFCEGKQEIIFIKGDALEVGEILKVNWDKIDIDEFVIGMNVELEHGSENEKTNVTDDDPIKTAQITLAHINENPKYYSDPMKKNWGKKESDKRIKSASKMETKS